MAEQGVTVAVPTLNRSGALANCLRDLLAQEHRPLEILVVDQSDEVPPEVSRLAKEHADAISYHRVNFKGLPLARNYAWQKARYDAIVYVDDDIRCGPRLVSEHLRALSIEGVGMVAGGIDEMNKPPDTGPPTGRFNHWTATASAGFAAGGEMDVEHAKGANFSVWRQVIEEAGGFDEALSVGAALYEELEFCLRVRKMGYRIRFNGKARVTHLAVQAGGCRMTDIRQYVYGMAHNRGVIARRNLGVIRQPVALARQLAYGVSFAVHYRAPSAMLSALTGFVRGFMRGGKPPLCQGTQPWRE